MAAISAIVINDDIRHDDSSQFDRPEAAHHQDRVRSPMRDIDTTSHGDDSLARSTIQDTEMRSPRPTVDAVPHSLPGTDHDRSNSEVIEDKESADGHDDSEDEGEGEEGGDLASRKKKGQRFFCTGYPPCNLSFTRSEHLARHIRKHTGERPFQCHCNRRFSRLDNLRQHAQTVHVNEEIPGDSLAATGTRYQRQIRTDRVRPVPRPRTSTMSSVGSHSRGHSRNLSASSIGSNSSVYSNAPDPRRRPPPLLMSNDNRPTTPPTYAHYSTHSPGDFTTPTSSTFPATPSSPNFSTMGSPSGSSPRLVNDMRTPTRRLSVPASYNPYYPYANPNAAGYGPGPAVPSTSSSTVTSPTASNFAQNTSQTMTSQYTATDDPRRRTWHPSSYSNMNLNYNRPATSGLTYSQTPDAPRPAHNQGAMSAAGQAPRLPGIESFDQVQHRPSTPPRTNRSPGQSLLAAPEFDIVRRGHSSHASWDGSKRSLYPDIDDNGRPATSWGRQTVDQMNQMRAAPPDQQFHRHSMGPPPSTNVQEPHHMAQDALSLESASKRVKRSGHFSGPGNAQRTSPDSSSSEGIQTPGTSAAEIIPAIVGGHGYIEPQLLQADSHHHTPCMTHPNSMPTNLPHQRRASELERLDALVAVATSRR